MMSTWPESASPTAPIRQCRQRRQRRQHGSTALLALLALLALPMLASCTDATSSKQPTPNPGAPMSESLRTFSAHPALAAVFVLGTEHFDNGQFTLRVSGDGAAKLTQRRSGTTEEFEKSLEPAAVNQLGEVLADNDFTKARTSTLPREPGDTPVVLELFDGDSSQFRAEIWEADRYDDKQLAAILSAAEEIIVSMVGRDSYP